jgi:hypothetical protein
MHLHIRQLLSELKLLYKTNLFSGLQPYLTRLTGLQVDEIIRLFGWMVAINPLGQAGAADAATNQNPSQNIVNQSEYAMHKRVEPLLNYLHNCKGVPRPRKRALLHAGENIPKPVNVKSRNFFMREGKLPPFPSHV